MLLRGLLLCPATILGLVCRVMPVGLCEFRFHIARSLDVDPDEDELRLVDDGGEDAPEAECRLYIFGEEVEALDLSTLPGTASREVEM